MKENLLHYLLQSNYYETIISQQLNINEDYTLKELYNWCPKEEKEEILTCNLAVRLCLRGIRHVCGDPIVGLRGGIMRGVMRRLGWGRTLGRLRLVRGDLLRRLRFTAFRHWGYLALLQTLICRASIL